MPRRIIPRKVVFPPKFKSFMPLGDCKTKGFIELLYEEYEAIKLVDYDMLNHLEAGKIMGISRATFARIYEKARRKVASALVENKEIRSVFGNAFLNENFFRCNDCGAIFNMPSENENFNCPVCKSISIIKNK